MQTIVDVFSEQCRYAKPMETSAIVSKIVNVVRCACPVKGFVKFEDGYWWDVGEAGARERVLFMLRDSLTGPTQDRSVWNLQSQIE